MRIAQWTTTTLAMVGVIFCLIVHTLTYRRTSLFHMPGKDASQPILAVMLVVVLVVSLLCHWSMPSPWQRPRLIGPPRRVNYIFSVAGFIGFLVIIPIALTGIRQVREFPVLLHGDTTEIVMRNGDRHPLSEEEYLHLKEQQDHWMGDLYYRGITAGLACMLTGIAVYGVWYIVRQPTLPNPQEDPYGFRLG